MSGVEACGRLSASSRDGEFCEEGRGEILVKRVSVVEIIVGGGGVGPDETSLMAERRPGEKLLVVGIVLADEVRECGSSPRANMAWRVAGIHPPRRYC